jgi:hypothetical protein
VGNTVADVVTHRRALRRGRSDSADRRLTYGRLRRLLAFESRLRRPERRSCLLTAPTSLEMSVGTALLNAAAIRKPAARIKSLSATDREVSWSDAVWQSPTDRRPIGFWLKLVDRLIDERLEASLGDLSRRHWQVLNVVQQGGVRQAEIDARVTPFLREGETIAQEVSDLQKRGWVTSGDSVELTELGTTEFQRLLAVVSTDRERLMVDINPDEYAFTVSTLERMARNLGWVPRAHADTTTPEQ